MRPLVQPWLKRNQNRCNEIYGQLHATRRKYFFLVAHGVHLGVKDGQEDAQFVPESDRSELSEQFKTEIQGLHERFETISPVRELPVDVERVGPTNLANTLSVAEEYPFEHYGMDTAVFWPRLCAEMEPEKLESLTTSFGAMNGLLNISLLSYVFAIECLIVGAGITLGWINLSHHHYFDSGGYSSSHPLAFWSGSAHIVRRYARPIRWETSCALRSIITVAGYCVVLI